VTLGRPVTLSEDTTATIRHLKAEGLSLRRIAEEMNSRHVPTAQNGRQWHASTIRSVLQRSLRAA
jgi:hypothetical protein